MSRSTPVTNAPATSAAARRTTRLMSLASSHFEGALDAADAGAVGRHRGTDGDATMPAATATPVTRAMANDSAVKALLHCVALRIDFVKYALQMKALCATAATRCRLLLAALGRLLQARGSFQSLPSGAGQMLWPVVVDCLRN